MSKRKERREKADLFTRVQGVVFPTDEGKSVRAHDPAPVIDDVLTSSPLFVQLMTPSGTPARRELPQMKKFRFQLLHQWITTHLQPGRVADVGGGKGLLAYLLQADGWQAMVIDPVFQVLPDKYKNIITGRQTRIPTEARVPRRDQPFSPDMAQDVDLLVAMHAHGCNIQLIDAAEKYGKSAILLPCCLIHEPLIPPAGISWIQALAEYAVQKRFAVQPFRLNFKGQNIGLYLHH